MDTNLKFHHTNLSKKGKTQRNASHDQFSLYFIVIYEMKNACKLLFVQKLI